MRTSINYTETNEHTRKNTFVSLHCFNTFLTKADRPLRRLGEIPESLNKEKSSSFDNINCKCLQHLPNSSALTFALWRPEVMLYLYWSRCDKLWCLIHLSLIRFGTEIVTGAISCTTFCAWTRACEMSRDYEREHVTVIQTKVISVTVCGLADKDGWGLLVREIGSEDQ